MLKFLNKTLAELQKTISTSKISDAAQISAILNSVQNKKPEYILKILEKDGLLKNFLRKKTEISDKKVSDISEFLSGDITKRPAIDVILHLYFFSVIKTGVDKIKWPERATHTAAVSTVENEWHSSDIDDLFLAECTKKPTSVPADKISEYIEGKRIMPPNTPFPGFWRNSRTPYLIEPMNNMSPSSPIQHTGIMKGAQLGFTAGAENIIAYWMDESPAEILYISATESLLMKWATKRLDPLIDSCEFRHKIYAQTENKGSRRTGDKIFSKEYVGGNLDMASAQSASGLRSDSKRILIRDEIDGAPLLLRTGEGNWLKVSDARTNAWGSRKKKLDFSTPTLFGSSLIDDIYQMGDKRKYTVPCPHCKKMQVLKFGSAHARHGIKRDGETVFYMCEHCHDPIYNHNKTWMLSRGVWEPTSTSSAKTLRTYQISSLYSPVGMYSWAEMWQEWESCQGDPEAMRSFTNLYLGLPFKESGQRPDLGVVIELRGGYKQRQVNNDILYITCGIDVQAGSSVDKKNPPRLELEILGIGAGFRTWSIRYKRIEGRVDDPYSGAWAAMNEWAADGGLNFKKKDGRDISVALVFVDSGDGNHTDIVYRFCSTWQNTYPIKGFSALRKRRKELGDEAGPSNFKRYRPIKISEGQMLYEISTNYYKTQIYNNLKIPRVPEYPQRPGFCDFPVDYGEKYFKMLTAEEKRGDGSFHCPSGRRNEALDTRVYALCAGDVYLDSLVQQARAAMKHQGSTALQIQQFTHRTMIDILVERNAT